VVASMGILGSRKVSTSGIVMGGRVGRALK
jgi:hypothetical protein